MKIPIDIALRGDQLILQNRSKILAEIKATGETAFTGFIESKKPKRTNQQNRAFFGVLVPHVQEALLGVGYQLSKEETHEWIKSEFLIVERVNEETGEIIKFSRGTSSLTRPEFNDLYERVQRFAAEYLNYSIPDPDPDWGK